MEPTGPNFVRPCHVITTSREFGKSNHGLCNTIRVKLGKGFKSKIQVTKNQNQFYYSRHSCVQKHTMFQILPGQFLLWPGAFGARERMSFD